MKRLAASFHEGFISACYNMSNRMEIAIPIQTIRR